MIKKVWIFSIRLEVRIEHECRNVKRYKLNIQNQHRVPSVSQLLFLLSFISGKRFAGGFFVWGGVQDFT